jgi:hypothetical protein
MKLSSLIAVAVLVSAATVATAAPVGFEPTSDWVDSKTTLGRTFTNTATLDDSADNDQWHYMEETTIDSPAAENMKMAIVGWKLNNSNTYGKNEISDSNPDQIYWGSGIAGSGHRAVVYFELGSTMAIGTNDAFSATIASSGNGGTGRWIVQVGGQLFASEESFGYSTMSTVTSSDLTTTNWGSISTANAATPNLDWASVDTFGSLDLSEVTGVGVYASRPFPNPRRWAFWDWDLLD